VALLVVPVVLLGAAEISLRLLSYGRPTSFFVPGHLNGNRVWVENTWFGLRFFPPALARSASPTVMRAEKPPGSYRIFLFGESAALGDPRPAFGVGRYLEVLLSERFPGIPFEVVNIAMTAINSHAIVPMARECASLKGDLWIVYMGNNELAGPFGATTVFGPAAPSYRWIRLSLLLQQTRLGQLIRELIHRYRPSKDTPENWDGLRMFLDRQVAPNDPRREQVYQNFQANLESIVRAGSRARVPIIFSTVAGNLKDCAPFGSWLRPDIDPTNRLVWEQLRQVGTHHSSQKHWSDAAQAYLPVLQLTPDHAETQFRLGQCLLLLSNTPAARASFVKARDLDTLPFRADSRINSMIVETAKHNKDRGVAFFDAEEKLSQLSPGQVIGEEFFHEHVHLNFDGNYQLAMGFAEKVMELLPLARGSKRTETWATAEICARRLALTEWNRHSVFEEMGRRLSEAPFTNQLDHEARMARLSHIMAETRSRMQPNLRDNARSTYEAAIQLRPDDHWLHHNYAEFLKSVGDLAQATVQMERVRDLTPQHYSGHLQLGRLYARQNKSEEARSSLEQALLLRPDLVEARIELGQLLVRQKMYADALKHYDLALRERPRDAGLYLLRAAALAHQEKPEEAIAVLRQAIQIRPAFTEAHYLLGVQWLLLKKVPEARLAFEEVVRLRPDHAMGHLNLGVTLARQEHFDQASVHFQEALRLDPANREARQFLETMRQIQSRSESQGNNKE
jgi:tetratricopeptide (TPR) repeat protein